MDFSPGLSALLNTPEPSYFNVPIKEEPVEILDSPDECSFNEDPKNHSGFVFPSHSATNGDAGSLTKNKAPKTPTKTSRNVPTKSINSPATEQAPITKKIMINGQAKTCMVVAIPELTQTITKKAQTSLKSARAPAVAQANQDPDRLVKCSRCLNKVYLNDFRRHIDNCLPRKVAPKSKPKEKKTKKDLQVTKQCQEIETQVEQRETVQVMYNPFSGEIVKNKLNLNNLVSNGSSNQTLTLQKGTVGPINNIIMPSFKETKIAPRKNRVKVNREAKVQLPSSFHGFYATFDETDMIQRKPKIQLTLNCHQCKFKTSSIIEMKSHIQKTHPDVNSPDKSTTPETTPNPKETCQQVGVIANKDVCDPVVVLGSDTLPNTSKNDGESGLDRSLESSSSNDSLPAFRGFEKSPTQGYLSTKIGNLNDFVRSHLQGLSDPPATEPPPPPIAEVLEMNSIDNATTDESTSDNNQSEKPADEDIPRQETQSIPTEVIVSPRRTRSKSVCGRLMRDKEKNHEMNEEPRRSMRLRSKSVCARKAESDAQESSPVKSRSKSVCGERIVSEKRTRDFKRAQSVPRGGATSETTSRGRGKDAASSETTRRGRSRGPKRSDATSRDKDTDKKGKFSKQNKEVGNAEQKATFRSRSKSVAAPKNDTMHPITYYQTLLKTRSKSVDRSKFMSDLNALKNNSDLGISKNSTDFGRETGNRVSSPEGSILGISKSKSVMSEISRLNDFNDSMEMESENDYDDLLLLADSTFSCSICSYTCDKERVLKDHERYHRKTNLPIFRCVYCNQRYTKYMLYSHVQNVHPGQKFQISEQEPNGVQPPQVSKVNEEARKSRVNTPSSKAAVDNDKKMSLNCSRCSFSTTQLDKMTLHLNKHESEDSETPKTGKNHLPATPVGHQPLKCTLCSFQTSTQEELRLHLQDHKLEPIIGTPGFAKLHIACPHCSFVSDELQKVRAHLNTHIRDNMAMKQCPYCDFKSTGKALAGHLTRCDGPPTKRPEKRIATEQNVVNSGPLKCTLCSFQTSTQEVLKSHLQDHKLEPIIGTPGFAKLHVACPHCSFASDELQKVRAHLNTHIRDNMAIKQCPYCDFKSTGKAVAGHLTRCDGSPTKRPEKLRATEQYVVKSGNGSIKKYECKSCSYKNLNSNKMKKHFALHRRNEEILECPRCDFRSTQKAFMYHLIICKGKDGAYDDTTESDKRKTHEEKISADEGSLKDSGDLKHECSICSYKSRQACDMKRHVKVHERGAPISKCEFCEYRSTARVLKFHRHACKKRAKDQEKQKVEPRSIFRCVHCKYCTTLRLKLNLHVKKHHLNRKEMNGNVDVKAHSCSRCPFTTNSQKKMKLHSIKCGDNFKCTLCSFSSAKHFYLKQHMTSHNQNLPVKKCPCCNFASIPGLLRKHQRKFNHRVLKSDAPKKQQSNKVKVDKNTKAYSCPRCDFSGDSRVELIRHSMECSANSKCRICSYSSASKSYMRAHMGSHKRKVPVRKCPFCEFASVPTILAKHQRLFDHTNDQNDHSCSRCTFTTNSEEKLLRHSRDECSANFKCSLCSYSSAYEGHIAMHMNSHKKGVPVNKCPCCDFASVPRLLARHQRVYEHMSLNVDDEQPISPKTIDNFKCTRCSYSCSQEMYLRQHMTAHKNNVPNEKCPQCDFESTPLQLFKHSRIHVGTRGSENETIKKRETFETTGSGNETVKKRKTLFECSQCSFSTPLRIKLKIHTKKYHQSFKAKHFTLLDKMYQCNHCSYSTKKKGHVLRHVNSHKSLKWTVNQCKHCNYKSTPHALKIHARTCRGKKEAKVQSSKAGVKKINEPSQQSELLVVPSRVRFTCTQCSYSAIRKAFLETHQNVHRRNTVLEQCANCTFRSTPRIVKNHFYSCTGRGNLDPLETDPPTLQRALEEASSAIESDPLNLFSLETPFLELKPPVLERADLILDKETAASSVETSPPILERVALPTVAKRTTSKDVTSDSVLKNFKCQYCSFESVLGYLLERHMFFHTVLKLPVLQCDNCDFRSTPGTLSAHQRACSENLRDKSSNTRQSRDKSLSKDLGEGGDLEKNQAKNTARASRSKSMCSQKGSPSANKRKLDRSDDDKRDKSLGRTPRKSRRLEQKLYANNSLKELFVDVVSCEPLKRARSRSRIRIEENLDFTANKVNDNRSTDSSKFSLLEEAYFGAKKSKTDSTQNISDVSAVRSRTRTKENLDSTADKVNKDHSTDSTKVSLLREYLEGKKSRTDSTQNISEVSAKESSRNIIRAEENPDSTAEKVNEDDGTDSSKVSLLEENDSEANTSKTDSISEVSAKISSILLEQARRRTETKDNSDFTADKVNEDHRTDSSSALLEKEHSEAKKSKTDSTQNVPEVSDKIESNSIRKKAFSCPKCNYSSSLRVKLRFHLKRCH